MQRDKQYAKSEGKTGRGDQKVKACVSKVYGKIELSPRVKKNEEDLKSNTKRNSSKKEEER